MKAVFVDTETSGLDPDRHVVLEIALIVVDLHTMECVDSFQSFVSDVNEWQLEHFSDQEALLINGITWDDIKDAPNHSVVGKNIIEFLQKNDIKEKGAFFIAQNATFDRMFFLQLVTIEDQEDHSFPYHWLDLASMYWIKVLTPLMSYNPFKEGSLSKDSIARSFTIPPEEKPHRAMNGAKHLLECFKYLRGL